MSEMNFPFQGGADEPESGGNRTKVLVAGAAGVLALVLLAVFVVVPMLSGGGDEEVPVARAKAPAGAKKAPAAKPKAPAAKPQALPKTFDENFQRDPFKPLYTPPTAAPATVTTGGTTAPVAGPAPVYPAPAAQPGSSSQVGGSRVALVDVFVRDGKSFAQTRVNSTVYTPGVGQVFAANYRLLTASGTCATYLYGDEQFQLCEGQEVLK